MAGLFRTWQPHSLPSSFPGRKSVYQFRCCLGAHDNNTISKRETPQLLKAAVSGVTELLRAVSFFNESSRVEKVTEKQGNECSLSDVDDVIMILRNDYENAYFVTGVFTSTVYTEDCIFEDPTIRFQGKELYSRNLKLLVPFFDSPSIKLEKIEKDINSETDFVLATWKLRTYLRLPWRPLICIGGSTVYELDGKFKIVRHAESWNVSALEAIGQIFTPGSWRPDN